MLSQMDESVAHTLVNYECDISHATHSHVLCQIIGIGAPGLLPGGTRGDQHIHCASEMPTDRRPDFVPAGFRGHGVDVAIRIDSKSLRHAGIAVYKTSTGVMLIGDTVPVEHIEWLQFLPAGLTSFKRIPYQRRARIPTTCDSFLCHN